MDGRIALACARKRIIRQRGTDDAFVDLGGLKGNLGSSNYLIPAGTDLSGFRSAVIWCRRFSVGFGVAPLNVPRSARIPSWEPVVQGQCCFRSSTLFRIEGA